MKIFRAIQRTVGRCSIFRGTQAYWWLKTYEVQPWKVVPKDILLERYLKVFEERARSHQRAFNVPRLLEAIKEIGD